MQIRKAVPEDAPAVAGLLRQIAAVHHEADPTIFSDGVKFDEDATLALIQGDDTMVYVACEDGRVLAHMILELRDNPAIGTRYPYRSLWVEDVCVSDELRGRGVGSMLMDHAEELARELGCKKLELNVWQCNERAVEFYVNRGMSTQRRIMELTL